MDGAMPKTVLISLAAVVALIVIVIFLGMRYLRADDEDEFEDGPAEGARSGSRSRRNPHDLARSRREHDDLPDQRFGERSRAAMPAGVSGRSGRSGRDASGRGGRAGDGRDGRGWRNNGNQEASRGSLPQRDSRPARSSGRRDHDHLGEPAAASGRRGLGTSERGGQRAIDEFDGRGARMSTSSRDRDRDRADGREGRDRWEGRDGRDSRDRRDARAGAGTRDTFAADRDDRDQRLVGRAAPKQDNSRKNGSDRDELLPAIKPRQGRGKRDPDGDWPSNEWDELSDVDYWAELASDKPLTSAPSSEQAGRPRRSDRGASRAEAEPGARADRAEDRSARQARKRDLARRSDRALAPAAARQVDQQPAGRSEDPIGNGSRGASVGRTDQLHAVPPGSGFGRDAIQSRHAEPDDDDPLTSPSFPRIAADDGRSYRRARRHAVDEPKPADQVSAGSTPRGYALPAAAASADYPGTGADYARSATDPYASIPAGATMPSYSVPAVAGAGYPSSTMGYVMPSSALPSSAMPSMPVPPSPGPVSSPMARHAQAESAGYLPPALPSPGYPGPGGYAGPGEVGHGGYQGSGGTSAGSYLPPTSAGAGGYAGETVVRGGYQPTSPDPAGFSVPAADAGGYQAPPGGYADPGLGGHSPRAATGGYAYPAEVADYRSDPADVRAGYPDYTHPRSASGPHPQPERGYLTSGYGGGQPPGIHTSLPGGQQDSGYPAYPPPVPGGQSSPYPASGDQGPALGYEDPYQQPPYDPAGYQVPAAPQPRYAGADPYAVDPYGYTGYGSGGR